MVVVRAIECHPVTDCVLAGLVERHLESLDRTIVRIDPTFHVETIRPNASRPPADRPDREQMRWIVLSIPRQASEPITTKDIALELLFSRAMDREDHPMTERVGVPWRT
jgi:hypothetical protein